MAAESSGWDDAPEGDQNPGSERESVAGRPAGGPYEWLHRGLALLARGDFAAAVQVLQHAAEAEPGSHSVREALARAQFQSGQFRAAQESFARLAAENPSSDYAQFGLGRALQKRGKFGLAVEHLSMAVAMNPANADYRSALERARAARDVTQAPSRATRPDAPERPGDEA